MSEVTTTTQHITALDFDINSAEQQLTYLETRVNQITQRIASTNWTVRAAVQNDGAITNLRNQLDAAALEIQRVTNEMINMNTRGTAATNRLVNTIESRLLFALRQIATETASTVKTVETAMVDISRVMQLTANETENLRGSLFDLGNEYGRSFDDVSDISLRFAQAGYNMSDTISLTEDALLALNTAELDSEEATQSLIGILSQWGMEASDLITIIDKLNYTADNNAVTTQDLIDGLLKASSMARTAGMSFDDTVGILTSMKVASGAAGKEVGNAFKSIMAYIQRPESLKLFESMGINVFADKVTGELLPMMDILENMSAKWNENQENMLDTLVASGDALQMMSEEWAIATDSLDEYTAYQEAAAEATDKANTAEARAQAQAAAGVYRRNYYISLMENLAQAQQVSNDLMNAEGHSAAENARYMETLAAKIEQLVVSLKELAVTAADAGMLDLAKSAIDTATSFIQLKNESGTLNSMLLTLAGTMLVLKKQKIATEMRAIANSFMSIPTGMNTIGVFGLIVAGLGIVDTAIKQNIQKQEEYRQSLIDTADVQKQQYNSIAGITDTYKELGDRYDELQNKTSLTVDEENELASITEELTGLQNSLSESYASLAKDIDLVNGSYDAQIEKLNELTKAELIALENSQKAALEAQKEQYKLNFGVGSATVSTSSAKYESEALDKAAGTLKSFGINPYEQFAFTEAHEAGQELQITIENSTNATYALQQALAYLEHEGLTATATYAALADAYNNVTENLNAVKTAEEELAQTKFNMYVLDEANAIEKLTVETFPEWRKGLLALEEDNLAVEAALGQLARTVEDTVKKDAFNELFAGEEELLTRLADMSNKGILTEGLFAGNNDFTKALGDKISASGLKISEIIGYIEVLAEKQKKLSTESDKAGSAVERTAEDISALAKTIETAEDKISTLNGYIQTLGEGNGLTAEQVLELVDTYGLLLDQFTLTENGYKIEISALEQLREAQVQSAISARNSQIEQTQVLQTGLLDRIKAYGLEINSIASLAEAQAALLAVEQQRNKTAESINSAADAEYYKGQLSDMDAIVDTLKDIAENYATTEDLAQGFYSTLGKSFEETKSTSEETVDILKEMTEGYEHLVSLGIYSTEEQIAYYENLRRTLSLTEEQYQSLESTLHKLYQTQLEESKEAIEAEYEAQKKAIEEQYELDKENREEYWKNEIDSLKDNLNDQIDTAKKAYEQKKKLTQKSYDNQKEALESLRDAEIESINAAYNAQIDALEKIKAARQAERDEEDYQNERAELLEQISYYEQRTGTEAVEQLADLRKQLADLDRERQRELEDEEIDSQIDSLESQRDDAASAVKKQYAAQIAALEASQQIELEMYEQTYEREIELLEERLEKETKALETKRDEDLKRLKEDKDEDIKEADDKWKQIEAIFEDSNLAMIAAAGLFAPQLYDQFHELFTEKFKMDLEELATLMGELEGDIGGFEGLSGSRPDFSAPSSAGSSNSSNTQDNSGSSGGFSVGTQVKVSGTVYGDSYGNDPGASFSNKKTTITKINNSGSKPYHVGSLGWVDSSQLVKARTGGKTTADGLAMLHKDELIINPPVTKMLEDLVKVLNPQVTKADIAAQQDAFCRYWGKEINASQRAMYQNVSNNNTYNNSNSSMDNHSKQTINNININAPLQQIERVEDNADMNAVVNALERDLERQIASKL